MKMLIPIALAPVVLSGCALTTHKPPTTPAQQFVTTLIQEQRPLIQQAQAELALVSNFRLKPKNPLPAVPQKTNKLVLNAANKSQSSMLAGQKIAGLHAVSFTDGRQGTPALAGAGQAQTLRQAVTRIAPVGWQHSYGPGITPDVRRPLQWRGNDQWPYVLNKLLLQENLQATIYGSTQRIVISNQFVGSTVTPTNSAVPVKPIKLSGNPVLSESKPVSASQVMIKNPFGQKLPPVVPVNNSATVVMPKTIVSPKVWRIEAGSTLKDTLFNWSATEKCSTPGVSHWTVAWLTPVNYRIDAPLQFEGSYREALNNLFTLYGSAKVPLYAGVRSNQCVISVDDKEIN
ncbi:toxin co-regulated pilus biosynthesis Q family protein [Yersinia enterocolitica]